MDNYLSKMSYLIKHQKNYCAISGKTIYDTSVIDLHHRSHNEKWRRKRFPLFLNSILNLQAVDHVEHLQNGSANKIHDLKAEQYEKFLERHPSISEFVNNPI